MADGRKPSSSGSGDVVPQSDAARIPELSFGFEVEGILVYHEDLLRQHLEPNTIIHKILSSDEERSQRFTKYSNSPWRSWAIKSLPNAVLEKYGTQALEITKKLLEKAAELGQLVPSAIICKDKDTMMTDYTQWQIVRDNSIVALDRKKKTEVLTSHGVSADHDQWDTHGIELVSPVYNLEQPNAAQQDIASLLAPLRTTQSSITTNETCGLHVHIGLPSGKRFSIEVLRILAFLTIIYEDHLSLLHPRHRSDNSLPDIRSNKLDHLYAEGEDDCDETVINGKIHVSTSKALQTIRKAIFATDTSNTPYEALARLMGPRTSFINWTRINNHTAATVEFRQHDASLDPNEIGHWVNFCASLVGLAYKYAADGMQPLPDMLSWEYPLDLAELLSELELHAGLPKETATCYHNRYANTLADKRDPNEHIWEKKILDDDGDLVSGIELEQ